MTMNGLWNIGELRIMIISEMYFTEPEERDICGVWPGLGNHVLSITPTQPTSANYNVKLPKSDADADGRI